MWNIIKLAMYIIGGAIWIIICVLLVAMEALKDFIMFLILYLLLQSFFT